MNSINFSVSELKGAVTGLGKVVSRRSTLPVLQHVRVSRDAKGSVSIQATDLDTFLSYHAPDVQAGPVVDMLVPMEHLVKGLKSSAAQDTVSLIVDSNKVKLRYSIGGSPIEQSLEPLSVTEWPPLPPIDQRPIAVDREFGLALRQALECSSDDPTRYVLRCACLDVTDKRFHYIVGTNGRMLYSANSFSFGLPKNVLIPNSKFMAASDFLDQEGGLLSVGSVKGVNWVKLQSPRWTYIARQIEGIYPNWKQVVPTGSDKSTNILLNDAALKQLLAVASKLPGDGDNDRPVRIRFDLQSVFIEGRAGDSQEWTSIPVPEAAAKGRRAAVMLNREYLIKALRFGLKQVEILDELSPVIFWHAGKKMIVMPLRPDASPASVPANTSPGNQENNRVGASNSEPTKTTTNERKTMHSQNPPQRGTAESSHTSPNQESRPALKHALEQVEQLKITLRDLAGQVGDVAALLKTAEKEQRGTSREVESVRATLRSLQKVAI
jgi:DNA polymerase III sliding clamp (beta) subunit (PCNA family)